MAAQIQRLLMLDGAIEHAKNYKSIDFFVRIIKNESNTIQLEILRKIILKWIVREVLENDLFSNTYENKQNVSNTVKLYFSSFTWNIQVHRP